MISPFSINTCEITKEIKEEYNNLKMKLNKFFCVNLSNFIECGENKKNKYYFNVFSDIIVLYNFIFSTMSDSFKKKNKMLPHLLTTKIHNKILFEFFEYLCESGRIKITYINSNIDGLLTPALFKNNIQYGETFLISIPYINIDTGSIIDIAEIGKIAHQYNIPLHVDLNSLNGIYNINLFANNIDCLTSSFNMIGSTLSYFILNYDVIYGYKLNLNLLIKNYEYTLSGYKQIKYVNVKMKDFIRNKNKNVKYLYKLKNSFIDLLRENIFEISYEKKKEMKQYLIDKKEKINNQNLYKNIIGNKMLEFTILGPDIKKNYKHVPYIIPISIIKNKGTNLSNTLIIENLRKKKFIVNIGNGLSTKYEISHLLDNLNLPSIIKKGIIIIYISEKNNYNDMIKLNKILFNLIKKQSTDIEQYI